MEKATAALEEIEFGLGALSQRQLNQIDELIRTLRREAGDYNS